MHTNKVLSLPALSSSATGGGGAGGNVSFTLLAKKQRKP